MNRLERLVATLRGKFGTCMSQECLAKSVVGGKVLAEFHGFRIGMTVQCRINLVDGLFRGGRVAHLGARMLRLPRAVGALVANDRNVSWLLDPRNGAMIRLPKNRFCDMKKSAAAVSKATDENNNYRTESIIKSKNS
jgi:hypothetical protein